MGASVFRALPSPTPCDSDTPMSFLGYVPAPDRTVLRADTPDERDIGLTLPHRCPTSASSGKARAFKPRRTGDSGTRAYQLKK